MHFEILVEGQTELTALSILMPKILGSYSDPHTWKIHKHRGIGNLPENPLAQPNPQNSTLLHLLPAKLRAYSKSPKPDRVVIVLLDLDDNDYDHFIAELRRLLEWCESGFIANFEFAIEELEAWYLGDLAAIEAFNPEVNLSVLRSYVQDSICNTWEYLAKADDPSILNHEKRSRFVLDKKREWSKKIPVEMNIENNASPSFNRFVSTIRSYI